MWKTPRETGLNLDFPNVALRPSWQPLMVTGHSRRNDVGRRISLDDLVKSTLEDATKGVANPLAVRIKLQGLVFGKTFRAIASVGWGG